MGYRVLCLVFTLCSILGSTNGQDRKPPKTADDEVIKVDTQLVDVPVVVTDRAGKPILNLKQNNFTVYEVAKS